jgi:hypothetical protein
MLIESQEDDLRISQNKYLTNLRKQQIKYFKDKSDHLETVLENTKSLMNMIIHELRSPSN